MLADDAGESDPLTPRHVGLEDPRGWIGQDPELVLPIADGQVEPPIVGLDRVDPAPHSHERTLQPLPDLR